MRQIGFDFYFPQDFLKPALTVSLLSVWVLVGIFHYLNGYTKRRYFTIWTAAWLFYALWITLRISLVGAAAANWVAMVSQWCIGISAMFLLWGSAEFLRLKSSQRSFGLFMGLILVCGYIGAYASDDALWAQLPVFWLIGAASVMTGGAFYAVRRREAFVGAGLLSFGFLLWGLFLFAHPFFQATEGFAAPAFLIAATLQLFIAVSMVILVLEEERASGKDTRRKFEDQLTETEILRSRMVSTEQRYQKLFDQASEAIIIASEADLRILELNEAARRLLGLDLSEGRHISLRPFCQFEQATQPQRAREWFEALCRQPQIGLLRRDGAVVAAEVTGAPIEFHGAPAYQFFFREMTERARLEQQLRQAEKLSALGQMISGVAHELNNPLAVIKGYIELVLSRHELGTQTRIDLEKVSHESDRAAKLVKNFLTFAREQSVNREAVNLNEIIERVLELRRFDLRLTGAELLLELDPALPSTLADQDHMQQVLVNLVHNALQAMLGMERPAKLRIASSREADTLRIIVEDNGPGIPPDVLRHIFEPFFTTKPVGTGTGLGLSIAHSIMTDHKGRIFHQEPENGVGACFVVELPIVRAAVPVPQPPPPEPKPKAPAPQPVPNARILVLDDEASIAELLGEMLGLLGYRATVANSPVEALEVARTREFDLILSDFRMPGMNGQQFYEALVECKPEMAGRVVFLTGDVVNEETQGFLRSIGTPHLSKPFQLAAVEKTVEQVLEKAAAASALSAG